jgi:prepilin-type N-terminal cleavage/methylation domain-containing protein/prepilin-type processing-associated H-X9-DG protein
MCANQVLPLAHRPGNRGLTRQASCLRATAPMSRRGFTLIEILVVVAIIALLIGILLPSLRAARDHARITVCKASLQQIGVNVANYQAEYKMYVPVLFGFGTSTGFNNPNPNDPEDLGHHPARTELISVALRKYSGSTRNLPPQFNPDALWTDDVKREYMRTRMPAYYACPYVRDLSQEMYVDGPQDKYIRGKLYQVYRYEGRYETMWPFMWDGRVIRGVAPGSLKEPNGTYMPPDTAGPAGGRLIDGRPKYSAISFNKAKINGINYPQPAGFLTVSKSDLLNDPLNNMARSWAAQDAHRLQSGSLSELTIIMCNQGEHLSYQAKQYNPGSHATNGMGGTNVAFADSHVEWVKGTMVGW